MTPDAAVRDSAVLGEQIDASASERIAPEPNLRAAFLGDQGLTADAVAVLELIAGEGADLVIHAGDLDYLGEPRTWEAMIDATLGRDFPYFVAIGNHDVPAWPGKGGYRDLLLKRIDRIGDASCSGDYGVRSLCEYRGLSFVLSGIGTFGDDHEAFIEDALSEREHVVRLCVWHKNQHDMQVGAKTDEVGWDAYRICAAHGAPIINGHEHSYSRTRTLLHVGARDVGHGAALEPFQLELEPGRTAVFVSGLGGKNARVFTPDHLFDTWWASIFAGGVQLHNGIAAGNEPAVTFGALFVDFHVDGDPRKARGYFKTIDGEVVDDFVMTMR
jgi:hypothetical protein